MWIIERLLSLVAPHSCVACGAEGYVLCKMCSVSLASVPSRCYRCHRVTLDFRVCKRCARQSKVYAVFACTAYTSAAKQVIYLLKYERAQAAAKDVAAVIAKQLPYKEGYIITHVPTVTARVRMRGYDQAALIARELARLTRSPYIPLLTRVREGRQVGQTRTMRQRQMRQAFCAVRPGALQKQHILLIDDVITTGATCEAAALTLRAAGARRVSVAVFAAA